MLITFSSEAEKDLKKIKERDQVLYKRITQKLAIFQENPRHPSLRTHKLTGNLENMWSLSVTMSIRMVYIITDNNLAVFISLGTHDEVYGK